jgi:hypothetical protein
MKAGQGSGPKGQYWQVRLEIPGRNPRLTPGAEFPLNSVPYTKSIRNIAISIHSQFYLFLTPAWEQLMRKRSLFSKRKNHSFIVVSIRCVSAVPITYPVCLMRERGSGG